MLVARCWGDTDPRAADWLTGFRVMQRPENQWCEFLWYKPNPFNAVIGLNRAYHAKGAGYATARTDWSHTAVQVHMQAGHRGEQRTDHNDNAAGQVQILRGGDYLLTAAKIHSASGLEKQARDNNAITVAGRGQTADQNTAQIVAFEETPDYTLIASEAGSAYDLKSAGHADLPLKAWTRTVLLLGQAVVLFDRVDKANLMTPVVLNLNAPHGISQAASGNWLATVNGNSQLLIDQLLPWGAQTTVVPVNYGPKDPVTHAPKTSSWRAEVAPAPGSEVDLFLNVCQAVEVNGALQPAKLVMSGMHEDWAATIGDTTVASIGAAEFLMFSTDSLHVLAFNLFPGVEFQITEIPENAAAPAVYALHASSAGVISFKARTQGKRQILIEALP